MDALIAVADRLANHNRNKAVLASVEGGGPHTTAGGDAGMDQGVYAECRQCRRKRSAEERRRVLFDDDNLAGPWLEPRAWFAERVPLDETLQRVDLAKEDATVGAVWLKLDTRVDDRNSGRPRRTQKSLCRYASVLDAGV